ncbi:hypothetical protein BJX99DRAFT_260216 [Aspergillus californicus]
MSLPPPPPPAAPFVQTKVIPRPPSIPAQSPRGFFMVNLLIYNGHPFKDHWAYFIQSHENPNLGVKIHATGSVSAGFVFEIKRSHNLQTTEDVPTKKVPLQWVAGALFDQEALVCEGEERIEYAPVGDFERALYKVDVPGKSLRNSNDVSKEDSGRKRVVQRDCQTWIVESARQLVQNGIFDQEVADYLRAVQQ